MMQALEQPPGRQMHPQPHQRHHDGSEYRTVPVRGERLPVNQMRQPHRFRQPRKRDDQRWNSILWGETFGFFLIIAPSWLTEAVLLSHLIYSARFTPDGHRTYFRTLV